MGTELQRSPNFFNTLPRSHGNTVTISFDTPDTRNSAKDRPLKEKTQSGPASDNLQHPMERLQCHRESLRETMLEHEKIFKEQVRELHRLYRTQKLLMSQMQSKLHPLAQTAPGAAEHPSSGLWSSASSGPPASSSPSTSNRHYRNAQLNNEHKPHLGHRTNPSLSSQDLTVCSKQNLRAQSDSLQHLPLSAAEARGQKLSVETPTSCFDEECDLDLTLSVGCGGSKKRTGRPSHSDTPSGCRPESSANSTGHRTATTPARSDPGGHAADPSVAFNREGLQRPAWLFQGLSLNRT